MEATELAERLEAISDSLGENNFMQAQIGIETLIMEWFPTIGRGLPHLHLFNRKPVATGKSFFTVEQQKAPPVEKTRSRSEWQPGEMASYARIHVCEQDTEDGPMIKQGTVLVHSSWRDMFRDDDNKFLTYVQKTYGLVGNCLVYEEADWVNRPFTSFIYVE